MKKVVGFIRRREERESGVGSRESGVRRERRERVGSRESEREERREERGERFGSWELGVSWS